jgi:hypothetical protein
MVVQLDAVETRSGRFRSDPCSRFAPHGPVKELECWPFDSMSNGQLSRPSCGPDADRVASPPGFQGKLTGALANLGGVISAASCRRWPSRNSRSDRSCRSPRRRRNCTTGPPRAAILYWPTLGQVPAAGLVLRRLLPLADAGLDSWASTPRCATGCSASSRDAARPGSTVRVAGQRRSRTAGRRGPTARRPCTRCWSATSRTCTATNPCTPGNDEPSTDTAWAPGPANARLGHRPRGGSPARVRAERRSRPGGRSAG